MSSDKPIKVGIGITTTPKRAEILELTKRQIDRYTPVADDRYKVEVVTVCDTEEKGVAFGKNKCLERLRNCDYVFLFDDDCFPVANGWMEFFIDHHLATENHHFLYLKDTPSIMRVAERGPIDRFNNAGGCFMFLTKEVLEKVGAFNPSYGRYGYEHAGYSLRIHKAGLTPYGEYLCPKGSEAYIYSLDYDNDTDFGVQMVYNIDPAKVAGYVDQNRKVFDEDVETIYQPLEGEEVA